MTDTVTSYDQVPYAYYSFPDSHPRRLQAVARLLGLETAAPKIIVLEISSAFRKPQPVYLIVISIDRIEKLGNGSFLIIRKI